MKYELVGETFNIYLIYDDLTIITLYANYNNKFENVELTGADKIWSWFCGGLAACGHSSQNVENWQSHIAGNHSHKYINIPVYKYREANKNYDIKFNSLKIDVYELYIKEHDKIIKDTTDKTFKGYLKNSRDILSDAINDYMLKWKIFEALDYFTFDQIKDVYSTIHSSYLLEIYLRRIHNDTFLSDIKEMLKPNLTKFNEMMKSTFEIDFVSDTSILLASKNTIYPIKQDIRNYITKKPINGYNIITECIKEGMYIVDFFKDHIHIGLSTPECATKMAEGIQRTLGEMRKMICDYSQMTDKERKNNIDDFLFKLNNSILSNEKLLKD